MTTSRQHPAVMLRYLGGFLFTLLAPLVPILISGRALPLAIILQLALSSLVVVWGVLRWRRSLWGCHGSISLRSGVLSRRESVIPSAAIACVELRRSPLFALLGANRIMIRTPSRPDDDFLTITTPRKASGDAIRSIIPLGLSAQGVTDRPAPREAAIFAASGSNFASGLLILIPVITGISKLGIDTVDRLEEGAASLFPHAPRIAAIAAAVPLVGWLAHFIHNCIVYAHFCAVRSGDTVIVRSGTISRRTVYIPHRYISATDTRRTLLLLFLRRASCSVLVSGCGSVPLISAAREAQLQSRLSSIITRPHGIRIEIAPDTANRFYLYRTRLIFAVISALLLIRLSYGTSSERFISIIFVPVTILLIWYTLIGIADSHRAKAVISGDSVEITGSRLLTVHTCRIYRTAVAEVRIKQNPLQKQRGLCDLYIRCCGQKHGISCRYVSIERAERFALMLR
ncbi:MAG: PH domain-containing protein [Clostridia bacterium]|nr:PH domain-containing protein [Clostridia bacterium]